MNCLTYALDFWRKNPSYRLYYNGDHVINCDTPPKNNFLPIEDYGLLHMHTSFVNCVERSTLVSLCIYFYELENPKPDTVPQGMYDTFKWMHLIDFVPNQLSYLFQIVYTY